MERSAVFWTCEMQGAQAYDFCGKKSFKLLFVWEKMFGNKDWNPCTA